MSDEMFSPNDLAEIELNGSEFSMDNKKSLGSGSYGQVYKLYWKKRNMNIAVKYFKGTDETVIKEFKKELKNLRRVKHPNIIKLYGVAKDTDSKPYIIMEYADCGSLSKCMRTGEITVSYFGIHHWMLQLAEAVAYMHGLSPPVIHRDLKPQNLLLTNNYRTLKICDFGTVRELASKMTTAPGTAIYTAPEVFEGKKYTEKCDVYSFAIILWQVFSKQEPYNHLGNQEYLTILNLICNKDERPDLDQVKKFPNRETIIFLIKTCWDKDPTRRPTMQLLKRILSMDPDSSLPKITKNNYTIVES
ncbi:mitogen-activated protein kinase kinase kinase 7-like isoform X3 [Drosophila grimshawi]|uniref:mitogen-activated protein kinase kinase kinase 7-like isoform X3 n=1 Tax=Drosophila grimshawi TaxID=7222 RepID=UPI000C86EEBF|nr:mitogen-activated protein kinase kinase kinase 7-like isoform X3 [Drosophila grimshawi]